MKFLEQVMAERRQDARDEAKKVPLDVLSEQVSDMEPRRSLMERLSRVAAAEACIVAELKRASPSAGVLREKCVADQTVSLYEKSGAMGISIVTEPRHFKGRFEDLAVARSASVLPILCKDFFTEPYQIYQAAARGADVVLLIAAALDFNQLRDLYIVATAIGLEVVVEVHTAYELEMVLPLTDTIIGVNSRDLRTMKTDLNVTRELSREIPSDRLTIAESGVRTRRDVKELRSLGYRGFLIGEALMRSANPELLLRILLGKCACKTVTK